MHNGKDRKKTPPAMHRGQHDCSQPFSQTVTYKKILLLTDIIFCDNVSFPQFERIKVPCKTTVFDFAQQLKEIQSVEGSYC